jgi:hypothetical protein
MKIAVEQNFWFFSHILESDPTLEFFFFYCFAVKFTILPLYVQAIHGNRCGKHLLNAGHPAPYHRL